jgi:hypothetical protein
MKYAPRFLIAKYVPDLRRMEPRNVGVIVWSEGETRARFSGEKVNGHVTVSPPSHLQIQSKRAYRQWIEYWRAILSKPVLVDNHGKAIDRKDSSFLGLVMGKSKQQYYLVDGGEFLEKVDPTKLDEVADELYADLVAVESESTSNQARAEASRELLRSCRAAVVESGLKERSDFFDGFHFACEFKGRTLPVHFDYALHGPYPTALMSRVYLSKFERVYSTAFEFKAMREVYGIPREKCAALIYPTEEELHDSNAKSMRSLMDDDVVVIDMRDLKSATRQIGQLAL